MADFEGAPFVSTADARAPVSVLPTPVGVDPGPLTPMGWGAEFGLDLATAARAMAASAPQNKPLILPHAPVEFDLRLENRFEQRLASREVRVGDPIPRPSGRGEGAELVGLKIADAIRAIEKATSVRNM